MQIVELLFFFVVLLLYIYMNSWRVVCFDLSIIHPNGTLLLKLNSGRVKHLQRVQVLMSHIIQTTLGP